MSPAGENVVASLAPAETWFHTAIMNMPKAAPDGVMAGFLLAFLATAGLFYVNIMQAIVSGLVKGLGFSNAAAGNVGAANTYGAAFGALIGVFLVRRIRWRSVAALLLVALIAIDAGSLLLTSSTMLVPLRFMHGTVGGVLVATAYSVMARTADPDRNFGILLIVQYGLGGLGNMYLPRLVPQFGVGVLFVTLAAFSLATLAMLPFLGAYPISTQARSGEHAPAASRRRAALLIAVLAAMFMFQAANMGLGSYVIPLGEKSNLGLNFVTSTVGEAQWIGVLGAALVACISTRFGRLWPLLIALLISIGGTWLFHSSSSEGAFLAANFLTSAVWAFVVPYLFGMCSQFDNRGYAAVLGGFASKMGLATGIKVGANLLGATDDFSLLINAAVVALVAAAVATLIPASAFPLGSPRTFSAPGESIPHRPTPWS